MLTLSLLTVLLAAILLGALANGESFGDTIRKGLKVLLLLLILWLLLEHADLVEALLADWVAYNEQDYQNLQN